MKKASVFRWLLFGLGAVTAIATALSSVENLTLATGLIAAATGLAGYATKFFGDVNGTGHIAVSKLPKEWQDILAGLGATPSSLEQAPANSNGMLQVVAQEDANSGK